MSGPGGVCVFSERQDVVLELLTVGRELTSGGTLISFAKRYWLIPMGFKNSSNKSSPGVIGLSLRIIIIPQ